MDKPKMKIERNKYLINIDNKQLLKELFWENQETPIFYGTCIIYNQVEILFL